MGERGSEGRGELEEWDEEGKERGVVWWGKMMKKMLKCWRSLVEGRGTCAGWVHLVACHRKFRG